MRGIWFVAVLVWASGSSLGAAQVARPLGSTASPYGYWEYLPPAYAQDQERRFPLLIFLHGLGEQGNGSTDLNKVTIHGPPKLINQGSTRFADRGVIVVSPQSPGWWNTGNLNSFIAHCVATYRVDESRIWLTGLSMGGGGTVAYARAYPQRLAAILPICPAVNGNNSQALAALPTWTIHNWGDGTVTRNNSINLVNSIAASISATAAACLDNYPHSDGVVSKPAAERLTGGFVNGAWTWSVGDVALPSAQPLITLDPRNGHDAWSAAYSSDAVWTWLFAQVQSFPRRVSVVVDPAPNNRILEVLAPAEVPLVTNEAGGGQAEVTSDQALLLGWVIGGMQ